MLYRLSVMLADMWQFELLEKHGLVVIFSSEY